MKTAVVVCPGRGVYNRTELGYLAAHHGTRREMFDRLDAQRSTAGQETLHALDGAATFAPARHTRGDNASALIFAASLADFQAIDRARIQVVAVTGNSMGWYSALACAGALSPENGFHLANRMGTLMQHHLIGGQIIYPVMDETWRPNPARKAEILGRVAEIDAQPNCVLRLSIDLGGMVVLAGDAAGLAAFEQLAEPLQGRFPMRLANHAAFHTDLQAPVAQAGRAELPVSLFTSPRLPLIDGRGVIWSPHATNIDALYAYTLGHQVVEPYDFTHAIRVAAREFAPDVFIVTGPGTTLGGATAQSLILSGWRGLSSRQDFEALQAQALSLISLGRPDQRDLAISALR